MPNARTFALRLKHLLIEGAYIPREYYIFDDRELIFMPIFKVASTSIKTALIRQDLPTVATYPDYMAIHKEGNFGRHSLLDPRRRRYFIFSFVRSPFDRLVSCYEDRVRRPIYLPIDRYYFDSDYNHILVKRLYGKCFDRNMTFSEFVELVARIPDFLSDGHFKSQYGWLYRFGHRIPNYVGKLENVDDDWEPLAARFGLTSLTHQNSSDRRDLTKYFESLAVIEAVAHRYRNDIREFGYEDAYLQLRTAVSG